MSDESAPKEETQQQELQQVQVSAEQPAAQGSSMQDKSAENAQLTEGKGFMDDPKIQKYLSRATKTMLLFAVLGCALIVVAVTAISWTFNSIFDKLPH